MTIDPRVSNEMLQAYASEHETRDTTKMARELLELRAQLAQEPVGYFQENEPGSYEQVDPQYKNADDVFPLYAAPPYAEHDRLAQCKADTQGPHWTQQAFAALGYLRDKMPPAEVTIVQRFLDAAVPESKETHSDHPARHWDRTCPACNPVAAQHGPKWLPCAICGQPNTPEHHAEHDRLAQAGKFVPMPDKLSSSTVDLVARFAAALAEKLRAAEIKYGYTNYWLDDDWMDECRKKLREHMEKGDPRDVAAYCAFLWHHGEATIKKEPKYEFPTAPAQEDKKP